MKTKAGWRLAIDFPNLAWDIDAIEAEAANDVVAEWEKVADRAYERGRKEALAEAAERVRGLPGSVPWDRVHRAAVLAILEDR